MHEAEPQPVYHPHVASRMPGRLRLRFRQARQHPELLHQLQTALEARPEVRAVSANLAATSLTVTYDAQRYSETSILGVLEDLDVLVAAVTGAPHLEAPGGPSHAAVTVAEALDDLDRRVLALTGHTLGLRVLFPFGLAGLGLVLTLENGLGLGTLPGWLPLWLAFDAFVKLYPRPSR
jgi:Heavy metal associated domain 2